MTRGKLWTGFLGLGLAGVAATATPRCRPAELGEPPLPSLPAAAAPTPVAPPPKLVDLVPPPSKPIDAAPPLPTIALELPAISAAPPVVSGPSSPPIMVTTAPNLPLAQAPALPPPVGVAPPKFEPSLPPIGDAVPPLPRVDAVTIPASDVPPMTKPVPTAQPETVVKTTLKLGRPRLDVESGPSTVLKVCADKLDVGTPPAKGETAAVLKAAGKVTFTTAGCTGTCDDLTVFPRTGEVILAGNVCVMCREANGGTVLTADVMKFKVPAATSYALPDPSGVVPASLKK